VYASAQNWRDKYSKWLGGIQEIPNSASVSVPAVYARAKGLPFVQPGKKRKGGKSRVIGISGLGRFFLFFPDFYF
jgi:hypothetical protein